MTRLEAALRTIVGDLRDLGKEFALLGGFAVSARTEPRMTKDIDFAVAVESDDEAEDLAFRLVQRGYVVETTVEQTNSGRLATVRTTSPSGAVVDLLFASCGIEPEVVSAATEIEILDGLTVPVATIGHLIAMKVLARDDRSRPQDRVDLAALFRVAGARDINDARAALDQVVARGYGRGRSLPDDLDHALTDLSPLP